MMVTWHSLPTTVMRKVLPFPTAPETYWLLDEFLRRAPLLFLSEARPISIEIPDADRPS